MMTPVTAQKLASSVRPLGVLVITSRIQSRPGILWLDKAHRHHLRAKPVWRSAEGGHQEVGW